MLSREIQHFFDEQAADWDYSFDEQKLDHLRQIFRQWIPVLAPPVLDLGCGTGVLLKVLPEVLPRPDVLVLELDISGAMLRRVLKKTNGFLQNVARIQGDCHSLALASRSVGSVTAFQVYPHFSEPQEVIREVHRVLKPGGCFIILHLMDHRTLNDFHRNSGGTVQNHYLPPSEQLADTLKETGFGVELVKEEAECYLVVARKA